MSATFAFRRIYLLLDDVGQSANRQFLAPLSTGKFAAQVYDHEKDVCARRQFEPADADPLVLVQWTEEPPGEAG